MRRLVVVSNRLPRTTPPSSPDGRGVPVGGLANALTDALSRAPGSLWLGWSGAVSTSAAQHRITTDVIAGVRVIGLSLSHREVTEYYRGFCNEVLWPLFHGFLDRVKVDRRHEKCYRQVSQRFAHELKRLLRPGDIVWVHDYHLLCLGRDLRRLGWKGPIGFFLHIPFPAHDLWEV